MEENLESELYKLRHFSDITKFTSRRYGYSVYLGWTFRGIIEKNPKIFKHGKYSWTVAEMLDYAYLGNSSHNKEEFIDAVKSLNNHEIDSYINGLERHLGGKIKVPQKLPKIGVDVAESVPQSDLKYPVIKDPHSNSELYRLRKYRDIEIFLTQEEGVIYSNEINFIYQLFTRKSELFRDKPNWRLSQMIEYALSGNPSTKKSKFIDSVHSLNDPEVEEYILKLIADREIKTPPNQVRYNKQHANKPPTKISAHLYDFNKNFATKDNEIPEKKPKSDTSPPAYYLDFGRVRTITGFNDDNLNQFIAQGKVLKIIREPITIASERVTMIDIGSLALHLFKVGYEAEAKKLDRMYSSVIGSSLDEFKIKNPD